MKMSVGNPQHFKIGFGDVKKAYERISHQINHTHVVRNEVCDETVGRNVFFKTENLQKTGAFKARGALNAVTLTMSNTEDSQFKIGLNNVKEASKRISPYLNRTQVIKNELCDSQVGRNVFFKTENLQKTGAFKARGALNAILALKETGSNYKGVITHSSGNHGQALAWAAKKAGMECSVVVPDCAPKMKADAIRDHGADMIFCRSNPVSRQETCQKNAEEKGYLYISSCDNYDVMAGQGTISLEFLEQVPELDAILIPTSGGGMIAGNAICAKAIKPDIKIFMVEPFGKDCEKCLRAGERLWPNPPAYLDTIADGLKVQQLGHLTFPIIVNLVEKDVLTVDDEEIAKAMKFAFEKMKLVVEGAGGAAIAAVMSEKFRGLDSSIKNVGVVLSGGNCDLDKLPWIHHEQQSALKNGINANES